MGFFFFSFGRTVSSWSRIKLKSRNYMLCRTKCDARFYTGTQLSGSEVSKKPALTFPLKRVCSGTLAVEGIPVSSGRVYLRNVVWGLHRSVHTQPCTPVLVRFSELLQTSQHVLCISLLSDQVLNNSQVK